MNHRAQFNDFQVFRSILLEINQKFLFCSKKRLSQKVAQNYPGRTFLHKRVLNGVIPVENYFELQIKPHWEVQRYFGDLYHFHMKLPKIPGSKSGNRTNKLRLDGNDLFLSNTYTEQTLWKTDLHLKMNHM